MAYAASNRQLDLRFQMGLLNERDAVTLACVRNDGAHLIPMAKRIFFLFYLKIWLEPYWVIIDRQWEGK